VDRLEHELRATFADERLTLPLRPDASHLVQAGVRRRRRTRAIATAAAAVVLVGGGVAAASLVRGGGGASERIVPPTGGGQPSSKPSQSTPGGEDFVFNPIPYDYHRPPSLPGAVPDPTVPWCRADQLSLSQAFQGATGSLTGAVVVTNGSGPTCALQGQPAVSMQTVAGHSLVTSTPEPFFVDAWIKLAPGSSATAAVTWFPEFCHEPPVGHVSIALPRSGGSLSTAIQGSPRCDVDTVVPQVGHLDVSGFVPNQTDPFTPLAGLAARLDRVPASVAPGARLTYRLQLQSMHARLVVMSSCLPYRERLVNRATHVVYEQDFVLNGCELGPVTIFDPPSLQTTYFHLQLAVPPSAPAGDYDLLWQSVLKPVNAVSDTVVHVQIGPAPCRDGQLTAAGGRGHWQAMNQYGHVIVLRNVSDSACSLRGYPGLRLVDSGGHPIGKDAARGGGYVYPDPGPTSVVLAPRTGTASFTFGGPAMTGGGQTPCPSSAAAIVYPPGLRQQLRVNLVEPYCEGGITVTAVVAGSGGVHF